MRVSIIVAIASNGVIGRGGTLPWRLSNDLKRFKTLTMGHHLIMGRKTFESLGRLLPGRISLVLKRLSSPYDYSSFDDQRRPIRLYQEQSGDISEYSPQPALPLAFPESLDRALQMAAGDDEVFIIGGGEIYDLSLPLADRLYVTHVEEDIAGDTYFPEVTWSDWLCVENSLHPADEKNDFPHRFAIYDRQPLTGTQPFHAGPTHARPGPRTP